jgi:hypothetical protein
MEINIAGAPDGTNIIDARWLFAAKRGLTHAFLKAGKLHRALPQGGTVVRLIPISDSMRAGSEPDYSWLKEFFPDA